MQILNSSAPACSLGGTINNGIDDLQNLQFLSLMNNQLEGTVPESICNLNINFSGGGGIEVLLLIFKEIIYVLHTLNVWKVLWDFEQNISNCTSDINWSFSLSEPIFIFGGQMKMNRIDNYIERFMQQFE